MMAIKEAREIVIDLNAIAADLRADLEVMTSEGGETLTRPHEHSQWHITARNPSQQQIRSADGILLEPLSLNEAKTCDDWYKWQEAMVSEMDSMHKMNVFKLVDIPKSGKLISVQWVYKLKLDAQ
ncbi:hypothetical protein NDA15_005779 [Ustilago hordei]|nr:hypothetical protein NDA15_005779 [Ustilago hordei]